MVARCVEIKLVAFQRCDHLWQSLGGLSKECVTNYGKVWVACKRNVRPIMADIGWPVKLKGMCDQLWQSLVGL